MSKTRKEIKLIETSPQKFIVAEINYDKGGMSFFGGASKRRGYYVSVFPEGRSTTESGITTRSYALFSGVCQFIEEAARFSASKLASLTVPADVVDGLIAKVKAETERRASR